MSLVGSLEDLGLGDILQIVSLSRKSGVLSLTWESRKGKILFRDGQVVSAISNQFPAGLEQVLGDVQSVKSDAISEAIALKRGMGAEKTVSQILVERLGAKSEETEEAIKHYVEKIVFFFFSWPEGNFNFELKEGHFEDAELGQPYSGIILAIGLNPQFLAMEGTRLQDEARRDGKMPMPEPSITPTLTIPTPRSPAPDSQIPADISGEHEQPRAEPGRPVAGRIPEGAAPQVLAADNIKAPTEESILPEVLVIDDDPEIINLVIERLRGIGLKGEGILNVGDAVRRLDDMLARGHCPVMVTDLFMPRTDGEGILGGLELVQTVKSRSPYVPIVLTSDYPNEAAEKEARELGLDHYIDKPKRSQIWGDKPTPELVKFNEALREVLPEMVAKAIIPHDKPEIVPGPRVAAPEEGLFDLGQTIREELGEAASPTGAANGGIVVSRGLDLLKSMINELNDPSFSGQITLMILRFAAELMNRSIIFLVARDQVAGLGQFGVELNGIDPSRQVRRMRIPISEPSIFRDIVQKRMIYKKPLPDTQWNNYLVKHLGEVRPAESFGAPIIAGGKIAAILYGDNVPRPESIGDTDSLEIFLAQAGLAMERAFLERRISELSAR